MYQAGRWRNNTDFYGDKNESRFEQLFEMHKVGNYKMKKVRRVMIYFYLVRQKRGQG